MCFVVMRADADEGEMLMTCYYTVSKVSMLNCVSMKWHEESDCYLLLIKTTLSGLCCGLFFRQYPASCSYKCSYQYMLKGKSLCILQKTISKEAEMFFVM